MGTVLIISSQTAASRVGATASSFCLQRLGFDTVILPTTQLGRHPGWGAPGGGAVAPDILRSVWEGVRAQGTKFDAVMTGYMGQVDHVSLAAEIITEVKSQSKSALILCDPVMGDAPKGLYIDETIAKRITSDLIPQADIVTPNMWELSYLTDQPITDLAAARQALSRQGAREAVMTSVKRGGQIGSLLHSDDGDYVCLHKEFYRIPNGGGDSFAALYLARRLRGQEPSKALRRATSSVFALLEKAVAEKSGELPLIAGQELLVSPTKLCDMECLS